VLWLVPANRSAGAAHEQIAAAPSGAHWLSSLLTDAGNAAAGHGLAIALMGAGVSAAIGLGVLTGRAPKLLLALSVLLALVYLVIGQGLGGIFTGSGTDPGSGPVLALLAVAIYPLAAHARAAVPARAARRRLSSAATLAGTDNR